MSLASYRASFGRKNARPVDPPRLTARPMAPWNRQRRIVILLSADDLDSREHRNLAYVALTRPEELLVVLYSHDTPIIREMLTNIEAAQSI